MPALSTPAMIKAASLIKEAMVGCCVMYYNNVVRWAGQTTNEGVEGNVNHVTFYSLTDHQLIQAFDGQITLTCVVAERKYAASRS
jgi:hypothetical protein